MCVFIHVQIVKSDKLCSVLVINHRFANSRRRDIISLLLGTVIVVLCCGYYYYYCYYFYNRVFCARPRAVRCNNNDT